MNRLCILGVLLGVLLLGAAFGDGGDLPDELVALLATEQAKLRAVTNEPHRMADSTAALCVTIPQVRSKIHDGFNVPSYCVVHTNRIAYATMMSGTGEYTAGSVIVKTKFRDKNDPKTVELYTLMRKRDAGYDSENGDWEYAVVDGHTRRLVARGRIDSCIACHAEYEQTDYVSREYLKNQGEPSHAR